MSIMNNNNQRALCQQLWAENKYLVLSHSSNIYKDIRQYLKQEVVELNTVRENKRRLIGSSKKDKEVKVEKATIVVG